MHLDVKSSNILLKYPLFYQDHGGSSDKTSARCSISSGLDDFDDALDQMMDGHIASNDENSILKGFCYDHPPGLAKLSDVGIAKILPLSQEYLVSSGELSTIMELYIVQNLFKSIQTCFFVLVSISRLYLF